MSGWFRPSVTVKVWVALLLYGGGWISDLTWFGRRGVRMVNTAEEGGINLETPEIVQSAYLLTNLPGIHSLTAGRAYNEGAVVEQRIERS